MLVNMLNEPVSKFTNHNMTTIDVGLTVSDAAKAMVETKSDSILVYTNYNVIGIVTLKDILHKIVAEGKDPSKTTIGIIATKSIIKIHKDAKVREAIAIMEKNDIRRLVVFNDERPILVRYHFQNSLPFFIIYFSSVKYSLHAIMLS